MPAGAGGLRPVVLLGAVAGSGAGGVFRFYRHVENLTDIGTSKDLLC